MPDLFQGLGNLAGGIGKAVGGAGEFLLHPLARGMSKTKQIQLQEAQRLIELAGGINTPAGAKVAAEQLNKFSPRPDKPWQASDFQGLSKTLGVSGLALTGATVGEEGGITKRFGLPKAAEGLSPDAISKRMTAISTDPAFATEADSPARAALQTEYNALQELQMELLGKKKVTIPGMPSKPAIPAVTETQKLWGMDWAWPDKTIAPAQEAIPATEPTTTWQDIVTEPTAPSAAAAAELKEQPMATRKAVSDAAVAGLSQAASKQITASYGADALEALSGLNESERTRALALIQAYQKKGVVDQKIRTRIRKMLGLK